MADEKMEGLRSTGAGNEGADLSPGADSQSKQHFRMKFKFVKCENIPAKLTGDLFIKWERGRGKESGRTIMMSPKGETILWPGSQTAVIYVNLKVSKTKVDAGGNTTFKPKKSLTVSLKQHKKGLGSSKDVGKIKLCLSDFVQDVGTKHQVPLNSNFSPPPVLEVIVTAERLSENEWNASSSKKGGHKSSPPSQAHWNNESSDLSSAHSLMSASVEDDDCNTMDTMSLADFSDLEDGSRGSYSTVELSRKYRTLRARAFQLRDALIKWQNHANKLKISNQNLNAKLRRAEADKKTAVAALQKLNSQLNSEKTNHEKILGELQQYREKATAMMEEIAVLKGEQRKLSSQLDAEGKSTEDLEAAQQYTQQVVEAYEEQKGKMEGNHQLIDSLRAQLKQKDEELRHANAELQVYQGKKNAFSRYFEKNSTMVSLVTSLVGLLALALAGVLFSGLSDW